MDKYVKGEWEVKANKEKFDQIKSLEYKIRCVAGLYANDMMINEVDLEMVDNLIEEINLTLRSNFEDLLSGLDLEDKDNG